MPIKTIGPAFIATCQACNTSLFVGWQPGEALPVDVGADKTPEEKAAQPAVMHTSKNEFDLVTGPVSCPCGVVRLELQHGRALVWWQAGKPEPTLLATNLH